MELLFFVSLLKIFLLLKVVNKTKESSQLSHGGCSLIKELYKNIDTNDFFYNLILIIYF